MLPMAGCRQPAIRSDPEDPVRVAFVPHTARAEASGRSAHAPVCSRAPASAARNRMLQGEANSCKVVRCMCIPVQTPETRSPRVWRPEGVRVASGDRGDRSPQAGSVGDRIKCVLQAARAQTAIAPFGRYIRLRSNGAMKQHGFYSIDRRHRRRWRTIRASNPMRNTFDEIIFSRL